MAHYQRYFNHFFKQAQSKVDTYKQERRRRADAQAETVRSGYRAADRAAVEQSRLSLDQVESDYREVYDANAVNEAVARRHAAEALANSQLVNSGLNATQQTAISLVRSRADSETTFRKQAAVANIMQRVDAERAQYRKQSAEETAAIYNQADEDVLDYENEQLENAQKQAQALADADIKAAEQAAKASQAAAKKTSLDQTAQENNKESNTNEDSLLQEGAGNGVSSKTQVEEEAIVKKQTEGDLAAWSYLRKCVNEELITPEERMEIISANGIRAPQMMTYEYVDNMVNRMMKNGDFEDARLFINTIIQNELIDPELIREVIYKVYL